MWRPGQDPEMIVKTLSSKIRKGFAEGVSRGHQQFVTVILRSLANFEVSWCGIKHARNILQHNGHANAEEDVIFRRFGNITGYQRCAGRARGD